MAAIGMMAYPPRPSFQTYAQSYSPYPSRSPSHTFSPTITHRSHSSSIPSACSLQRYQISPAPSPQVSRPSTSESETKPSLPSISNLLGIADRERTLHHVHQPSVTSHPNFSSVKDSSFETAVGSAAYERSSGVNEVPSPTPSQADTERLPNTTSLPRVKTPPFLPSFSLAAVEQRMPAIAHSNTSSSQIHVSSPSSSSRYTASPRSDHTSISYPSSTASAYWDVPSQAHSSALLAQRALPTAFPPATTSSHSVASPLAGHDASAPSPWEHHHYISPSSQASFPQTQDRYICPACNKAFSRPSSLKIHSHSHTGEKPFKCPHSGCNKAFSVRSNMKRHERGCHAGLATGLANSTVAHVR